MLDYYDDKMGGAAIKLSSRISITYILEIHNIGWPIGIRTLEKVFKE